MCVTSHSFCLLIKQLLLSVQVPPVSPLRSIGMVPRQHRGCSVEERYPIRRSLLSAANDLITARVFIATSLRRYSVRTQAKDIQPNRYSRMNFFVLLQAAAQQPILDHRYVYLAMYIVEINGGC